MKIEFRSATIADLDLLQHWDRQPHVMMSNPQDPWDWEQDLPHNYPWRDQLIAEEAGRPIGFVQVMDPAEDEFHYWGDIAHGFRAIDIWIGDERDLAQGYGTRMMEMALDRCFADPEVSAVLVDPLEVNTRAQEFYRRLGFEQIEHRQFGDTNCLVFQLTREVWEEKRKEG